MPPDYPVKDFIECVRWKCSDGRLFANKSDAERYQKAIDRRCLTEWWMERVAPQVLDTENYDQEKRADALLRHLLLSFNVTPKQ